MSNVEAGARTAQVWTSAASGVQAVPKGNAANPAVTPALKENSEAESTVGLNVVENPEDVRKAESSLDELIEKSNSSEQLISRNLKINVDDASGKYILSVHDAKTDEVIRQWPPEGYIKMAQNISRLVDENRSTG